MFLEIDFDYGEFSLSPRLLLPSFDSGG